MALFDQISEMIVKEKLGEENNYTPIYPSGIDILDYRNGTVDGDKITTGFDGGRIITVIGKSGSGKSSLAIGLACNIVEPFEDGAIFHFDFERATKIPRIKAISGWTDEMIKTKYKNLNRDIYSESIYKTVKGIDKLKNSPEVYDNIKIDTGEVDEEGKPIYCLPPTVILIDSWAVMMPKDISEEEELSGSMSASSIAKVNNAVIKRIVGPLERGNITLIIINHLTKKIEINAFAKSQADINYLKQDESMPGGTSCIYLANNIIRVTTSNKLEEKDLYGIKGFMVKGELIKSRSNEAGRQFEMVFEQSKGFNNTLTNLANFKELGLLKGSPRAYYLEECPDIKFTLKTFMDKYEENEKLRKVVSKLVKENYVKFIPQSETVNIDNDSEEDDSDGVTLVKCINKKEDIWLGSDGNYYDSDGNELEIEE